ncbi:MAG: hypothetical protein JWO32_1717 [Bacteroidetes bacterium]|nr:hypothetical protein [Bacteroidota bacterium]
MSDSTLKDTNFLFNTMQLLQAYEQGIDENIISTITDSKGIIVHANKKFCEVSKFSVGEIIGQNHRIINSGYHPKEFFINMWQTISAGKVWHQEIRNKAKDGTFYWVDTVIVPIKDKDETISHFLSLRTLITDRKILEKKKEQYVSSLEVLLVMTSNKVKKPLMKCLDEINNFDRDKLINKPELTQMVNNLRVSVAELDNFTNELSVFIREMEK